MLTSPQGLEAAMRLGLADAKDSDLLVPDGPETDEAILRLARGAV